MNMRVASIISVLGISLAFSACREEPILSTEELELAKSFALPSLGPVPADPSNRVADDPKAAALGEALFSDMRLSGDGAIACAHCHEPQNQFQDSLPRAIAAGRSLRRTMPLAGAQWGSWFFWDGRKDSQWSQALGPLEHPLEHATTRSDVAKRVLTHYGDAYAEVFGEVPNFTHWLDNASPNLAGEPQARWSQMDAMDLTAIDTVFANIGKAIAAYERTLLPSENRFDRFVAALTLGEAPKNDAQLSESELAGFRIFAGKGRCHHCHSGPRFSDDFFHNTGVPLPDDIGGVDFGRAAIVELVTQDPFSCFGPYSDAKRDQCRELRFMSKDKKLFEGAFKTPMLRGVATRAPYMHAGQFQTLSQVVDHYIAAPDPFSDIPDIDGSTKPHGRHSELMPLDLTEKEKADLITFLTIL